MNSTKHRFWVAELSAPAAALSAAEAHHALHVLRLSVGDAVELFDGRGRWAAGRITAVRRDAVHVAVPAIEGPLDRPAPLVHLAFAPPKGSRLDWLLEECAELGAASLRPLVCTRGVVRVRDDEDTRRRWGAICAAAVRQSRQVYIPDILPPLALAELPPITADERGVIAHGRTDLPTLATALTKSASSPPREVRLLVGPEGGWTDEELQAAQARGFAPARLGHTTLRVETAAVALVAATVALCEV